MKFVRIHLIFLICLFSLSASLAQTPGSEEEPIRYIGQPKIVDQHYHDGQLRPAVGVHSYQVLRANKTNPPEDDGSGNRYNHAPMLAYWNATFYLEYLGSEWKEHGTPTQTYLFSSKNGVDWDQPRLVFPAIEYASGKFTIAHQRMGFYVAPNGRLLVLAFYGIPIGDVDSPNNGNGIGRAVREIYKDNTFGPIHFIRAIPHSDYPKEKTTRFYPWFENSEDKEFVEACLALLKNKLLTQQWWEEDRSQDGFFAIDNSHPGFSCKALCFYHRKDGNVVGLWKQAWAAMSEDEGETWSTPAKIHSKPTEGAKEWCQKTADGRYALVYNPMPGNYYRWPLGIISGDDGILFDNLLVVQTEVPRPRFTGQFKNIGSNYVRGIVEGNGTSLGNYLWVTYSMNKEDIWVSRIPVPVIGKVTESVNDSFENPAALENWNIYKPKWAPVTVENVDGNGVLKLEDEDLHDYAKAVRVFPESQKTKIKFSINLQNNREGQFEVDVLDRYGNRAFTIQFVSGRDLIWTSNGNAVSHLGYYKENRWYKYEIDLDAEMKTYSVSIDGDQKLTDVSFYQNNIESLERIEFRTGFYRREDSRPYLHFIKKEYIQPGADEPGPKHVVYIDDLFIE